MIFITKRRDFFNVFTTEKEKDLTDMQIIERVSALHGLKTEELEVTANWTFENLKPQDYAWVVNHPADKLSLMVPPTQEDGYTYVDNDVEWGEDGYVSSDVKVFLVEIKQVHC